MKSALHAKIENRRTQTRFPAGSMWGREKRLMPWDEVCADPQNELIPQRRARRAEAARRTHSSGEEGSLCRRGVPRGVWWQWPEQIGPRP